MNHHMFSHFVAAINHYKSPLLTSYNVYSHGHNCGSFPLNKSIQLRAQDVSSAESQLRAGCRGIAEGALNQGTRGWC